MLKTKRRDFITLAGALVGSAVLMNPINALAMINPGEKKYVHQVYFWLKNPGNDADKTKLTEGLRTLASIKLIQQIHIGLPAKTERPVIDRSYALSLLLIFNNQKDQEAYQIHPKHLEFVKNYSALWERVQIYDSEDI